MTFTELERELVAKGIAPDAIAINEVPSDGQLCIQHDGQTAEVFRQERGLKEFSESFADVSAAIARFRELVLADQRSYRDWDGRIR